eukprot:TRINITY_DN17490_c0_g5_i1.p1 TRINITY_DN17490_c0_g5~~TRINITY_DN17490_c0_g5_i1.p1  ORF type:complete len:662 (+),score=63.78 TRINITY_DN17490_c0_g5_i1:52-2037(+)
MVCKFVLLGLGYATIAHSARNLNELNHLDVNDGSIATSADEHATAFAFAGGGIRAHSVSVGYLAGMCGSSKKQISDILEVEAIASASGASWALGSLLWSKNFNDMIVRMGADSERAEAIFKEEWVDKWKQIQKSATKRAEMLTCCAPKGRTRCGLRKSTPSEISISGQTFCCPQAVVGACSRKRPADACASGLHPTMFGETEYCCPDGKAKQHFSQGVACADQAEVRDLAKHAFKLSEFMGWFMFRSALSFQELVAKILEIPGDIDASLPLSTTPVRWALGKDLFMSASLLTPSLKVTDGMMMNVVPGSTASCDARVLRAHTLNESSSVVASWNCTGDLCGTQVPARFAVKLGSSRSPLEFTATEGQTALHMEYQIPECRAAFISSESLQSPPQVNFWSTAHSTPIAQAVAGSSSFFGALNVVGGTMMPKRIQETLPSYILERFVSSQVPLLASEPMESTNFKGARTLLSEGDLQNIARHHLLEVAGGDTTDSTGIAALVAAGHTNIVVLYNSVGFHTRGSLVLRGLQNLMTSEPGTPVRAAGYTLFGEDMHSVQQHIDEFRRFDAAANSTELAAIYVGELPLTTVDAPAYGVDGGQGVTLRLIIVDAKAVGCCGMDFDKYAALAGEIVQTFVTNTALARQVLTWQGRTASHVEGSGGLGC